MVNVKRMAFSPNHRCHVRNGGAGHPRERNGGGDGELLFGIVTKLGDQRVVGRAVERERNVVADHRDEQERAVDPARIVDWTPKHQHGDEGEWKGRKFEERHATTGF